jgi:hypothetical protein
MNTALLVIRLVVGLLSLVPGRGPQAQREQLREAA